MTVENKKSHLNDELKFLITCCQTDPYEDDIEFINSYLLNVSDYNKEVTTYISYIIALASAHGILPLVYKTLKKLLQDSSSLNPQHITLNTTLINELSLHYQSIAKRNMLMTSELIKIMHLLKENHIEALALKGPTLSQMAYGDITLRQYSDLDILVNEREILKAGSVLDEHGYDPSFTIKILKNETCLSSTNDLSFYNPSNGLLIELHWRLFREKIGQHLSFNQISENKQILKINGKSLSTLSSEMLLAYLCLHGSKHAWERIEWICDIDRLVRSEINLDWDKIIKIVKEMDSHTTLQLGLLLSHTLLHTPLPESIITSIQTERIKTLASKTYELLNGPLAENEGYAKYSVIHMYQMDLLDTKLKKLNHLFTTYLGISKNDCQVFPLPPSLKFLYIFIKPFRVAYKYLHVKK